MFPDENPTADFIKNKLLPCVVMAGVVAVVILVFRITPPAPKPTIAHTTILIDQTDKLSSRCIAMVEDLLENLPDRIEVGEELSIFAISQNSDITVTPLLHVKNPGKEADQLIEGYVYKQKKFEEEFLTPLKSVANGTLEREPSNTSPIIETINRVATWHKFSPELPRRTMIIYSDLLQNSAKCSDYPKTKIVHPLFTECPELENLNGVNVDVYYILRNSKKTKQIQSLAHKTHWIDRFMRANATVTFHDTL